MRHSLPQEVWSVEKEKLVAGGVFCGRSSARQKSRQKDNNARREVGEGEVGNNARREVGEGEGGKSEPESPKSPRGTDRRTELREKVGVGWNRNAEDVFGWSEGVEKAEVLRGSEA